MSDVLDLSVVLRSFAHTDGLPLYATNPAVVDAAAGLYLVRITPLSYVCSPVHTLRIVASRYAENSHTAIVRIGVDGRTELLHRLANSQDARGVLAPSRRALFVFHNTEVNASGDEQLARMEVVRYRLGHRTINGQASGSWRPTFVQLIRRVELFAAGGGVTALSGTRALAPTTEWRLHKMEKNWTPFALAATGEQHVALLSYTLSPHVVLRCTLADGGCVRAYETDSPTLWESAMATLQDDRRFRQPPRGGAPCLPAHTRYLCVGHVRTRHKRQYKCAAGGAARKAANQCSMLLSHHMQAT
jgi:hypothetical protein